MIRINVKTSGANRTGSFIEKFSVPEAALDVIDRIVTPIEQNALEHLPPVFQTEDVRKALREITGMETSAEDAENFVMEAYRRGVFSIEDEAKKLYKSGSFYGRLDVFAINENETYRSFPEDVRKALDGWYFSAYLEWLDPDLSSRPTDDEVITLEEALHGIDEDSRQIYLAPCDCRSLSGACGEPVLTCLSYRNAPNTFAHRGLSKPVTKEEARQVVLMAHKAGLVHTRNRGGICNCCRDCCYLFRARMARNSGALWPRAGKVIYIDSETCVSCGICAGRCRFTALKLENGKLSLDSEKCVGCGICADACPAGALKLKERV
jgi:ferredoxin